MSDEEGNFTENVEGGDNEFGDDDFGDDEFGEDDFDNSAEGTLKGKLSGPEIQQQQLTSAL